MRAWRRARSISRSTNRGRASYPASRSTVSTASPARTERSRSADRPPSNTPIPFVRVKPGIFGLLRYPEGAVEPLPGDKEAEKAEKPEKEAAAPAPGSAEADREGRRRRRRGGRGGKGRREPRPGVQGGVEAAPV